MKSIERNYLMQSDDMYWFGPNIIAQNLSGSGVNAYHEVKIYAPNVLRLGATLDHWDTTFSPLSMSQPPLMKQPLNISYLETFRRRDIDYTRHLLTDIWWNFKNTTVTPQRLIFYGSNSSKALTESQSVCFSSNVNTNITVDSIVVTGPDATKFLFTTSTPTPFIVGLGGMFTIDVSFDTTLVGYKKANLEIYCSGGPTNHYTIPLEGYAYNLDSDGDGIPDLDETRDLDLENIGYTESF